jgi:hypothetical protein
VELFKEDGMKIFLYLFFLLNATFVFAMFISSAGCQEPFKPHYEYAVDYYAPDSLRGKMQTWITETVRAADQHLNAGDYEDVEDIVIYTKREAQQLFSVRGEGLWFKESENDIMLSDEFIPYERMTATEKAEFEKVRPKTK